jgi:hypothetical protein
MRSLSMGVTSLAVLCVCWSASAEDLSKQETAARNFSYQGVSIGTTTEDFLKKFPNAQLEEVDKTNVTRAYGARESDGRQVKVEFFSGKIYALTVYFPPDMLSGIGGKPVFEKKLTDTFGTSPSREGNYCKWAFPRVNRRLMYWWWDDDNDATISIIDTVANDQRITIQAGKLDIGF